MRYPVRKWFVLLAMVSLSFSYALWGSSQQAYAQDFADTVAPAGPLYISPLPDAQLVSPDTTLSIRYGATVDAKVTQSVHFAVTGSKSGVHSGQIRLADDAQTLIFVPDQPFHLLEEVTVTIGVDDSDNVFTFRFTTTPTAPAIYAATNLKTSLAGMATPGSVQAQSGPLSDQDRYLLPNDFPQITVTTPANGTSAGYLFLSNFNFGDCVVAPYLLILDNFGQAVFYRALPACTVAADFKRQPNGLLTYWHMGSFHVLDSTYTEVDTIQAGHGYSTDIHELQILPNQHALLMSYDTQVISNTQGIIPNGRITATVTGLIIQELDIQKNVVFEWRSWDHFLITDTVDVYLQTEPVDYVHGNALELDTDGNLLLSSRHLNEITKINRQTGNVMWRLGGKHNQFTFVGDTRPFSHQHDIRRLPNGNITLFDNGNFLTPSYSRAVEYRLDERKKTATLVREYRNTPDTYGFAMGSNQRLPNNNVLVGWGTSNNPAITEFRADGTKAFELALASPNMNYRALRFEWQGYPATEPALVVITETTPTLYYSWNGATEILGYRIYGGTTSEPDTLIDTTFKTSFGAETNLAAAIERFCYFRVMPIDKQGRDTRYSNTVFVESPACIQAQLEEQATYLPLVVQ